MNHGLISVIIPTYKRPPVMVKRAICSVLRQSYSNIEVIIVDDSPADYENRKAVGEMIVSLNDNRVRYIQHAHNMGACAARNTGIQAARGDFLAFLDDDDEWLANKLEKQISRMSDADIGLVYCRQRIVNDTNGTTMIDQRKCFSGKVFDALICENFIGSTSFVLIRKECFQKVGMFNVHFESAQDYEMWLRIASKYFVDFVDEPLVVYHVHEYERITDNPRKKIQGLEALNEIYSDYLEQHRKAKSIRIIKIIPYYLEIGDIKKAIVSYIHAVSLAPFNIKWNLEYLKYFIKMGKH